MKISVLSITCWLSVGVSVCIYLPLWESMFLSVGGPHGVRSLWGISVDARRGLCGKAWGSLCVCVEGGVSVWEGTK